MYHTDPSALSCSLFGAHVSLWLLAAHGGLAVALGLTLWQSRKDALPAGRVLIVFIAAYVSAAIGARLFSVFFDGHWGYFRDHPDRILDPYSGGFVLYGGVFCALLVSGVACRVLRLSFASLADAAVPGIAFGLAIGRLGCFSVGCCYGRPTMSVFGIEYRNFAVAARPIGVALHPTQLYDGLGLALLGVVLLLTARHLRQSVGRGGVFLAFVAAYATLRFGVEFLRADPRGTIAGLPTSQALSLVIAPAAIAWTIRLRRASVSASR